MLKHERSEGLAIAWKKSLPTATAIGQIKCDMELRH